MDVYVYSAWQKLYLLSFASKNCRSALIAVVGVVISLDQRLHSTAT